MVQPCFSMEVRGPARPTLGKREGARRGKDIANKLWCQLTGGRYSVEADHGRKRCGCVLLPRLRR